VLTILVKAFLAIPAERGVLPEVNASRIRQNMLITIDNKQAYNYPHYYTAAIFKYIHLLIHFPLSIRHP
jgi:hypothetical protein